jgi:hypothetical protein
MMGSCSTKLLRELAGRKGISDQNYIEYGIRLLEIARNAQEFYLSRGQAERAALLHFVMPGSTLKDEKVVPTFKPPFDIINRIAQEARTYQLSTKKQAPANLANACPILLPEHNRKRTLERRPRL